METSGKTTTLRKLRRVAMTREEVDLERRWRRRELDDVFFTVFAVVALFGCPVLVALGVLGVLP